MDVVTIKSQMGAKHCRKHGRNLASFAFPVRRLTPNDRARRRSWHSSSRNAIHAFRRGWYRHTICIYWLRYKELPTLALSLETNNIQSTNYNSHTNPQVNLLNLDLTSLSTAYRLQPHSRQTGHCAEITKQWERIVLTNVFKWWPVRSHNGRLREARSPPSDGKSSK